MRPTLPTYDSLVIGGGLFGCYAALYLAGLGRRVLLLEREPELFRKASVVNQARLHGGYHYPRAIATARMADGHRARFTGEHRDFILTDFEQYYAIDRYNSLTDAGQFVRFCDKLELPCQRVERPELFDNRRLEAVFLTTEYTFDPVLMAAYYRQRIRETAGITVRLGTQVTKAVAQPGGWRVETDGPAGTESAACREVINATYAGTNGINRLFGQPDLDLQYEISEMVLLTAPGRNPFGLTVMDGPFVSLMPYGRTGLLSLSSVAYTHHRVSQGPLPVFDCQQRRADCSPLSLGACNGCRQRPGSNFRKMMAQLRLYLSPDVELRYFDSLYTIKTKLRSSYIDDGRPTAIRRLGENPAFYCIFAGKINSIYEIEKVIE